MLHFLNRELERIHNVPSATLTHLHSPQALLYFSSPGTAYQSGEHSDISKGRGGKKKKKKLMKTFLWLLESLLKICFLLTSFSEHLSHIFHMTEKQRENRNTWYLSFSQFFTPLPSHKEGIFHSALTQKYSLCTKPPSLLPAFSASHLHKEKTQDPRAGPYPCKKKSGLHF